MSVAQNSGLRACLVEEGALEPLIRALGVEGKLLPLLLGLMTEEGLALKHLASIIVNFSKDDDMRVSETSDQMQSWNSPI